MRRRQVFLLIFVSVLAVVVGGVALRGHVRESRADRLAVKYGAAPSKGEATPVDRCIGTMREEYNTSNDPRKAGLGEKTYALLVPEVCGLGVERDLVADDGTMSSQAGSDLLVAVMERMGPARFQTLQFNDLAVSVYHLAKSGHVTRWHRCVAMSYSGYDARSVKERVGIPRLQFQRISRETCTAAVEQGIIPASGAPALGSAALQEFQRLLLSHVLEISQS
jgi:hypothetical protein